MNDKKVKVQFQLEPEVVDFLKTYCRHMGVGLSETVNQIVTEWAEVSGSSAMEPCTDVLKLSEPVPTNIIPINSFPQPTGIALRC